MQTSRWGCCVFTCVLSSEELALDNLVAPVFFPPPPDIESQLKPTGNERSPDPLAKLLFLIPFPGRELPLLDTTATDN